MNEFQEKVFRYWYKNLRPRGATDYDSGISFFGLYVCLNLVMAIESGKETDRQMINWIKTNKNSVKKAFDRLMHPEKEMRSETFEKALKALRKETQKQPLIDRRGNAIRIGDFNSFEQVLEMIYQIRCNLFHGSKTPTDRRGLILLRYGTQALEKLVSNIHKQYFETV